MQWWGALTQQFQGIAARTGLAEPTVAKVLKILAQSEIVEGLRGARGGYRLTRPLHSITLAEVIVAFDGPIALTACVDGGMGGCESEHSCPVRGRWDPVNHAIRQALAGISVAQLAGGNCGASSLITSEQPVTIEHVVTTTHFVAAE
jgi:Rrf2 family protein